MIRCRDFSLVVTLCYLLYYVKSFPEDQPLYFQELPLPLKTVICLLGIVFVFPQLITLLLNLFSRNHQEVILESGMIIATDDLRNAVTLVIDNHTYLPKIWRIEAMLNAVDNDFIVDLRVDDHCHCKLHINHRTISDKRQLLQMTARIFDSYPIYQPVPTNRLNNLKGLSLLGLHSNLQVWHDLQKRSQIEAQLPNKRISKTSDITREPLRRSLELA